MEQEKNNYAKDCLAADSRVVQEGVGKNIIPEPERESLFKLFLEKFKDPIVTILMLTASRSAVFSAIKSAVISASRLQ